VSVLRLHSLYVLSVSTDVTWDNGPAAYWSSVELNVGIICACMPTMKAFLTRFFPKLMGNSSGRNGQPSSLRHTGTTTAGGRLGTFRAGSQGFEMQKGWSDTAALDPNKIQVITLIEQEHVGVEEEDTESISSSPNRDTRHAAPAVVATSVGNWRDEGVHTGRSHGSV